MKEWIQKKYLLMLIKIIAAVAMFILACGVYPFRFISIADVSLSPDGYLDGSNLQEISLKKGMIIRQEIKISALAKLRAVDFVVTDKTYEEQDQLSILLLNQNGEVLADAEILLRDISCNQIHTVYFNSGFLPKEECYLCLQVSGSENVSASFVFSDKLMAGYLGQGYWGDEAGGNVCLLGLDITRYAQKDDILYVWGICLFFICLLCIPWKRIGLAYLRIFLVLFFLCGGILVSYYQFMSPTVGNYPVLKKLYMVLALIALITVCVHLFMIHKSREIPVERYFLVSILGWGMIYLIMMPPFSYADEPTHFSQANAYVNRIMGVNERDSDGQIYMRNEDLIDNVSFPGRDSLNKYYSNTFRGKIQDGYGVMGTPSGRGISRAPATAYLTAGAGILIGRLFHLNYVWLFFITGLLGLLFYGGILGLAIHLVPAGKWSLFLIGQFPIALHMAGSITYDLTNTALLILLFALYYKIMRQERFVSIKQGIVVLILSLIVFPIKYAYFPLCFLFLMIPKHKFRWKHLGVIKLLYLLLCLCFLMRDQTLLSHFSNLIQVQAADASGEGTLPLNEEDTVRIQDLYVKKTQGFQSASEVLKDRSNIFKITVNTFFNQTDKWWNGTIGYFMGWGDCFVPDFILDIFLVLLLLTVLEKENEGYALKQRERLLVLGTAVLCFGAVYLSMFLYAIPIGSKVNPSVNGRYLLPILPLVCTALKGKRICLKNNISEEGFLIITDFCQVAAMIYIFTGYVNR